MQCTKCEHKAVLALQHGGLCKSHFIRYFEEKVFKTIAKYKLIDRNDTICVAASGGKDSLTVLYLIQKYCEKSNISTENIVALCVDEGIADYREHSIVDLKTFCEKYNITYKIVSNKGEFGYTLDEAHPLIAKETKKKPCNTCGVWRRYLLNKYAKEMGATKVVTGHNLDDEAQVIVMNMFKANTTLASHIGPKTGVQDDKLFSQRVKPLYFCTEKETRLYALLRGFDVKFTECPNAQQGYRAAIRDMLNDFEVKYPGTKQGIVKSFLSIRPILKEHEKGKQKPIRQCSKCSEPANGEVCNACKLVGVLENV